MLDNIDKKIIRLTQDGLPLATQPYLNIAEQLEVSAAEVMKRMQQMLDKGIIRRIAAVPNHYKLGYVANGMSVWNIADEKILGYGKRIGQLPFVSHCYQRPRHPGVWKYNLFAMIHALDRNQVEKHVGTIAELVGDDNRGHEVLYSKRMLKKTGMRI